MVTLTINPHISECHGIHIPLLWNACKQPRFTAVAEALLGVLSSRGLTDGGVDNQG